MSEKKRFSMATAPTTLDVGRALARLDEHGLLPWHGPGYLDQVVTIDGVPWTTDEMCDKVGELLAEQMGYIVRLGKVSRRDVALIMAAHQMNVTVIQHHARRIARYVRARHLQHGSWSSSV